MKKVGLAFDNKYLFAIMDGITTNKGALPMKKEKRIITENPIAALIAEMSAAKKGEFCVFTNYEDSKGQVSTIYGQIGMDYGDARTQAIEALKEAIEAKDFEDLTIEGQCNFDPVTETFNARKKKGCELLKPYSQTFKSSEVLAMAKSILYDWENPVEKKNNEIKLSEQVVYNEETENFNVKVLVSQQVYKADLSAPSKPKNQAPETKLKEKIRKRFMKDVKSLTICKDNCEKVSLNGAEIHLKK